MSLRIHYNGKMRQFVEIQQVSPKCIFFTEEQRGPFMLLDVTNPDVAKYQAVAMPTAILEVFKPEEKVWIVPATLTVDVQ